MKSIFIMFLLNFSGYIFHLDAWAWARALTYTSTLNRSCFTLKMVVEWLEWNLINKTGESWIFGTNHAHTIEDQRIERPLDKNPWDVTCLKNQMKQISILGRVEIIIIIINNNRSCAAYGILEFDSRATEIIWAHRHTGEAIK